jgi:hypothetical protein
MHKCRFLLLCCFVKCELFLLSVTNFHCLKITFVCQGGHITVVTLSFLCIIFAVVQNIFFNKVLNQINTYYNVDLSSHDRTHKHLHL